MARLCAPVRDETIRGLMRESDVLTVFRGVMETLDLMRLDMANFTIQQIRPHIVAQVCTAFLIELEVVFQVMWNLYSLQKGSTLVLHTAVYNT